MNKPHIVAFGGGVDSTAMILGLYESNRPIDLILFAEARSTIHSENEARG